MKSTLKGIFNSIGLLPLAKKINRKLFMAKYPSKWKLELDGLSVLFNTTDYHSKTWFYPRYLNAKIHEPIATKLFIKHIKPKSTILDIGGHLGYFSCIAAKLAREGSVNVFEVDPQCVDLIKNNAKLNKLDNLTVNHLAVADKTDKVKIPRNSKPNPSLNIGGNFDSQYIEVNATTVDQFISERGLNPDFIKIDVEGAELKVLQGMPKLLAKDELTLLIEIHVKSLIESFDSDYKDCLAILLANGFQLYNIDHRHEDAGFVEVHSHTVLKGNPMLLCLKS